MAIDYVSLAAMAQVLITENGRAITFRQLDRTVTDSSKPWRGNVNPRNTPEATLVASGVFVEPSSAVRLGMSTDSSELVKRSEAIIIVGGAVADLEKYDEVVDGAKAWRIVGLERLQPGASVLLYFVGVMGK